VYDEQVMPRALPRDGRASLLATALGIGVGVGALVGALRAVGAFEWAELRAYDLGVRARVNARVTGPGAPIVLIRIREQEVAAHGHPIPDAVLARAISKLLAAEVSALGVDLYRVPPAPGAATEDWQALSRSARDPRVVFIEKLPDTGRPGVAAPAFARERGQVGFSDLPLDPDGLVRRGLLMLWDAEDRPWLSLSLQLALRALQPQGIGLTADPEVAEYVRLGQITIPPLESDDGSYVDLDAGGYQMLLDFARGPETFASVTLSDLLDGAVDPSLLAGRIAILGTTAPSVKDDFRTPLGGPWTHGIELHAHAADQLLRFAAGGARPARFWGDASEWAWILAWAVGAALLAARIRSPWALTAAGAVLLVALMGSAAALFAAGWWIPWVPPAAAGLGAGGLVLAEVTRRERAERAVVMDLFGRYVSRGVAEELWQARDAFMEGGRPRPQSLVLTAMLTDLRGYTGAAEKMEPPALMEWLNEYMDRMTRLIEEHGGFVDDYTGDGIKANFGVPIARASEVQVAEDARMAVRCALAMGRALEDLTARWRERGLPQTGMRIGLSTGEGIAGSIGSAERMKYTTVGDTVNTAARLETFHKEEFEAECADGGPVFRILIGDTTHRHLGEEFETEFLGEHVLRGRGVPVGVYRVRGLRPPAHQAEVPR
jgi:adenylate cyclase